MGEFWKSTGNGIVGGSLGIIGNLISGAIQRQTAEEQTRLSAELGLRNAKEMAGVNFGYNEQAADNAMSRSKELADYNQALGLDTTQKLWERYNSPEAKRKALQDAGLSVGLMYSGGGAQGTVGTQAASGAAPQGGTGGPSAGGTPIGMGIQLELGRIASEAAVNNAIARKTNAEAATEEGGNDRGKAEIALLKNQATSEFFKSQIAEFDKILKQNEYQYWTNNGGEKLIEKLNANLDQWKAEAKKAKAIGGAYEADFRAYFEAMRDEMIAKATKMAADAKVADYQASAEEFADIGNMWEAIAALGRWLKNLFQ